MQVCSCLTSLYGTKVRMQRNMLGLGDQFLTKIPPVHQLTFTL